MGGIKLQLLCGVRIELTVGSLPYLARLPSRSLPIPLGGGGYKVPFEEKGVLQTCQPLELEEESQFRDIPSLE